MLIEYSFDLSVEERWVTMLILQLYFEVAPELIMLREHRYHGDLKNLSCKTQFMKLQLDVPFLSGQISSKYFKSSSGRTLSIGMQYLPSYLGICIYRYTKEQTISRAIYPSIVSLPIYDGQNLGLSSTPLHRQLRIRASRGKDNRRA
jgi:hypothetical protein